MNGVHRSLYFPTVDNNTVQCCSLEMRMEYSAYSDGVTIIHLPEYFFLKNSHESLFCR